MGCTTNTLIFLLLGMLNCFLCSEAVAGGKDDGDDGVPAGFSVFDALRDTIYSEVATLIANNENRPHFLVSRVHSMLHATTPKAQPNFHCLASLN